MDVPKNVLPPSAEVTTVKEEDVKTSLLPAEEPAAKRASAETVPEDTGEPKEEQTPKGSKTPETQLYSKLREERERRRELERELRELREISSQPFAGGEEYQGDAGKELKDMRQKLAVIERKEVMRELYQTHPELQDKRDEFEEFLEDDENSLISLPRAAKLFLLEKGLLAEKNVDRRGLESPTGGSKTPSQSGLSEDDVKRLRENQPRKYLRMIREGVLKPEEIK